MTILETKVFENDGVMVELYLMNDGKPAVRVSDIPTSETIGITIFPSQDRAKSGFDAFVAKTIAHGGC